MIAWATNTATTEINFMRERWKRQFCSQEPSEQRLFQKLGLFMLSFKFPSLLAIFKGSKKENFAGYIAKSSVDNQDDMI